MDEVTRRAALAAMMATGTVQAKDDPPKEKELKTDRDFVMAAGLTEAEADCWAVVADAAGKFFALPKLHPMDDHEVAHAIHVIQNKLLGRPTYRKYLETAKAAGEKKK
ncbi:MAG TPA: hypothetical protein VM597_28750 [Gemmataceae bacterium]|nr:hypothetical protein [Gemmataceae bacterium]